jgi:putative transposase
MVTSGRFGSGAPTHVWAYDFMFDATLGGRRMKVLTVIDEFSREVLAIVPARSLTASALKAVLAKIFTSRGKPATIRSDNGPECIAFELTEWSLKRGGSGPTPSIRTARSAT